MKKNGVKLVLVMLLIGLRLSSLAQHKTIPLNNFYKQEFLKYSGKRSLETFYPVNESYLNLSDSISDNNTMYYDFLVWFTKKNWIEIKEDVGSLEISPLVNLSYGAGFNPADTLALYRNTRGIYATGEFSNKVSYSFIFCENQARFMNYQNTYFHERGEVYDQDTVYQKVNAVIPGGGRTKPFKVTGFDYAFSIGSIAYQANKKLRFEFGNNQHFIGSGYRSLLLSDNSFYAPSFRFNWKISEKISYQILYRKHKNLFRKPATFAVERAYENKLFSASYFTFKAKENLSLSLFTAGNQLREDSIFKHPVEWQMLVPLPFFNTDFAINSPRVNGIAGLNFDLAFKKSRFYGQIAADKRIFKYLLAIQAGFYRFDLFKIKNLNLQIELNYVPDQFYAAGTEKLSYSQYNLPLAHPKGNNFTEIYTDINYTFKRFYFKNSFSIYLTQGGDVSEQIQSNSIFNLNKDSSTFSNGNTLVNMLEIGYRINKKYNPTIFMQCQLRSSHFSAFGTKKEYNNMIMAGLKVNLINQYLDF